MEETIFVSHGLVISEFIFDDKTMSKAYVVQCYQGSAASSSLESKEYLVKYVQAEEILLFTETSQDIYYFFVLTP